MIKRASRWILPCLRGSANLQFHLTPVLAKTEDPKEARYRLGFMNTSEMKVTQLSLQQAIALSLEQNRQVFLSCSSSRRRKSLQGRSR